jgi:hypothetical protein
VGGSYQLLGATKADFRLSVNHREFAAALFADCQHLVNQVLEHRANLLRSIERPDEPSPTWMFVGLYYMSLYSAMAWTRITNGAVVYLDKEAIRKYCQGSVVMPGGGSYLVEITPGAGTNAEVRFSKSISHFHEAVWLQAAKEAGAAYAWIEKLSSTRAPTSEELLALRAMKLLRGTPFGSQPVWPSKLRNALNYRPGFSYRGVPNNNILRIKSRLSKQPFSNLEEIIEYGERAILAIAVTKHPSDAPNESIDLLLAIVLILDKYVDESLAEICSIHGIKSAAHAERARFRKSHCRGSFSVLNDSA